MSRGTLVSGLLYRNLCLSIALDEVLDHLDLGDLLICHEIPEPETSSCWRARCVAWLLRRVACDCAGLVEGLELLAPDAAQLELGKPGSMNAWDSGSR